MDLSPVVSRSQPLTPTAPGVPGLVWSCCKKLQRRVWGSCSLRNLCSRHFLNPKKNVWLPSVPVLHFPSALRWLIVCLPWPVRPHTVGPPPPTASATPRPRLPVLGHTCLPRSLSNKPSLLPPHGPGPLTCCSVCLQGYSPDRLLHPSLTSSGLWWKVSLTPQFFHSLALLPSFFFLYHLISDYVTPLFYLSLKCLFCSCYVPGATLRALEGQNC